MTLQSNTKESVQLYPQDINTLQIFPIELNFVKSIKILFNESSDFFGRITLYKFDLLGT